jgi:ribosomal protein S14
LHIPCPTKASTTLAHEPTAKGHATGPLQYPASPFFFHKHADKRSVVNGEKKKSGLIRKYGLNMSRQAFREKAADMGWVKVSEIGYVLGKDA